MAYIPSTGSVVAFQSDPTKLVGTVSVSGITFDNSSVVAVLKNSSVTTLQGTNPWQINVPTPSLIAYQAAGSVLAVSGSFTTGNTSVSGYIESTNTSIFTVLKSSSVTTLQGTNPWVIGNNSVTINNIVTGQSSVYLIPGVGVLGSVATLQGTNPWLIGNNSVMTIQGTTPWVVGSVIATVQSSVAVAVINFTASVAANINVISASIVANQGTNPWVIGSIVGTFADNTAFTTNDKGIGVLTVRNDTVASIVNADKQYGQFTIDSAGRQLIKPYAATEASIYAHASVVNGGDSGSVLVLSGAGTGLRNYITDWNISNTGSVATLITFTEGGGSVLGRTIAPAGGGSNNPGAMMPMANVVANQPFNMVTATASSVVYVTVRGYKAP